MLIRRAELDAGRVVDVRLAGGRVVEVGPGLPGVAGEPALDAAGGALLPGLHDHHLHLFALAAAERSLGLGPPAVRSREELSRALREGEPSGGWLRGVGYHESVAGELDRDVLDGLAPGRGPLRVQHRSGALWIVNSAGAAALGLDRGDDAPGVERDAAGRATGRLYHLDAWLRERTGGGRPPPLAGVGATLARRGVTGVTDAGVHNGPAELRALLAAVDAGELPQRLVVMGTPELPDPGHPAIHRGPVKLVLREQAPVPTETLAARITAAHAGGRAVAVHCVTRAELVLALAGFREADPAPGDRIEHASVAPPDTVAQLAELGLAVVTQPNFVDERGDAYLTDVEPRDRPWLYRGRGFLDAGVPLGGGTDAPFGDPDPWRAIRSAVERRTASGAPLGPGEALAPERALALFTTPPEAPGGSPRRVAVGAPADLCLLDRPWSRAREALSSRLVRATLCGGRLAWCADGAPRTGGMP